MTRPAAYRSAAFYQAQDDYDSDGEPQTPVAHWLDDTWQGDDDSLVSYLSELDDGAGDVTKDAPWGTSDTVFPHGPYLVSHNRRLGYVALCVPLDESGEPIAPEYPTT